MSDQPKKSPGLNDIKSPSSQPSDSPDDKTSAESKDLEAKAMSAGVRADKSHADHLTALFNRIEYEIGEKERFREELRDCQKQLEDEKNRAECFHVESERQKVVASSVSWTSLVGAITSTLGGLSVGIAGAMPRLPNESKSFLTGIGTGIILVGCCVIVISFVFSQWSIRKKKQTTTPE